MTFIYPTKVLLIMSKLKWLPKRNLQIENCINGGKISHMLILEYQNGENRRHALFGGVFSIS